MEKEVIFIAGVYGVGKSTLCKKLGKLLGLPWFSAGDLISEVNGEIYGENKVVKDKATNQAILAQVVGEVLQTNDTIILAGHFCIFNSKNEVDILPEAVFTQMPIIKIILLEASVDKIIGNIATRDHKTYSTEALKNLIFSEKEQALIISEKLNIPIIVHEMKFDNNDELEIAKGLKGSNLK